MPLKKLYLCLGLWYYIFAEIFWQYYPIVSANYVNKAFGNIPNGLEV